MTLQQWTLSEVEYGRRVLNSGLEGVRSGRDTFLGGESLTPYIRESLRQAWKPAAIGVCIGVLSGPRYSRRSAGRVLAFGLLGGAVGFTTSIAWKSRRLTASVLSGVRKNVGRVRDEHWLERHPIDYA